MLPREFCLWLEAVLGDQENDALTLEKTTLIKETLSSVFRHEIDPSMGGESHQRSFDAIHSGLHNR
jgi:hypothetical protein